MLRRASPKIQLSEEPSVPPDPDTRAKRIRLPFHCNPGQHLTILGDLPSWSKLSDYLFCTKMLGAIVAKMGAGTKTLQNAPPASTPPVIAVQQRQRPNEAIFNTQFTTAGKRFLHKIKKNRAMQVDRRTRGFQLGLEQRTVVIDPFTGNHYRVMIVDSDMLRRENLADDLEQRFEIIVAPSNERAFALLGLFEVNFVLLRLDIGNDQTAATSPALAFLREMKRSCFRTPVAALVDPSFNTDHEAQKLLARALQQGGVCGYFEEGLDPDLLTERIAKLLRSISVAQNELARCRGTPTQPSPEQNTSKAAARVQPQASPPQQLDNQVVNRARVTPPSSASGPKRLPTADVPNTRPSSVKFDRPGMLLELSLNQRKQCLRQREALQATFASAPHSVLGIDIDSSPKSVRPATPSAPCLSPLSPSFGSPGRQTKVKKKIPPLPSPKQVSHLIYTRPQELQTRIGRHLYERLHIAGPPDAVPQDPLLNHCVVLDPRTQGRDLIVGKAYMLYCEQRLDEALLHCDRALRTPNQTLEKLARLLRGALYDARGEHGRAEAEFLACLQLDPSMHEAHFNLSVARLKLGKDTLALQALTQALTLDPQNDKYLHNRGLMYRRMGHFVQAQSEYCKREIASGAASASPGGRRGLSNARISSGSIVSTSATRSAQPMRGKLSKCEMEDGMFAHLFGKPTPDKLALACPATERSADMLSAIVARLQTLLFFQDFSREMLTQVAQTLDYDVVACGKSFTLGETHAQNFYVLLGGRLSVRRRVGTTDFASIVTTHHLEAGAVFGCAGFTISAQASLIADECAEIGILWPDDYTATIQAVTSQTNHDVFAFLQQLRGFRRLTTSELGHVVGISERKRFRKGDVLLEQNEQPRHLFVLWKGSCSVYQDFDSAPLSRRKLRPSAESDGWSDEEEEEEDDSDDSEQDNVEGDNRRARRHARHGDDDDKAATPPFHRLIAQSDWPLGFQARTRARKYRRGRRHGLMLSRTPHVVGALSTAPPLTMSLPMRCVKEKLPAHDKNALVQKCVAPAVFGESRFLDPTHAPSKCCVVAESLVEVLLFDHMRLQEMGLQSEVISELFDAAPKYLSEKEVAQKQADVATWDEYRNLRLLELSKNRWPEAKRHLRALSNGCSIMLTDHSRAVLESSSSPSSSRTSPAHKL